MLAGPGVESNQLPVVVAKEDHVSGGGHGAGPACRLSRERILPRALPRLGVIGAQKELARFIVFRTGSASGEILLRLGLLRR